MYYIFLKNSIVEYDMRRKGKETYSFMYFSGIPF